MKLHPTLLSLFVLIVPLGIALLTVGDMVELASGKSDYPFGNEFFSKNSIYSSETIYVGYSIILGIICSLAIYLAFKRRWRAYAVSALLGIIVFLYPILTNE